MTTTTGTRKAKESQQRAECRCLFVSAVTSSGANLTLVKVYYAQGDSFLHLLKKKQRRRRRREGIFMMMMIFCLKVRNIW